MERNLLKKAVLIGVFIFGVICITSCRSTKQSCGLADYTPTGIHKINHTTTDYLL